MQKNNLRSCIVKMVSVTNHRVSGNCKVENKVEERKGFFHCWCHDAFIANSYIIGESLGQITSTYGLVEYEDGTIHKVLPECIKFIDRVDYG